VETGYLLVTGLHVIMHHVAAVLQRQAAGKVKCSYIITTSTDCGLVTCFCDLFDGLPVTVLTSLVKMSSFDSKHLR